MDQETLELLPMSDKLLVNREWLFPLDFSIRKFNCAWRSFYLSNNCLSLWFRRKQLKMLFFSWINFLIFLFIQGGSSPTFIIIKTGMERCNSTTHMLLRTWFTLNQVTTKSLLQFKSPFLMSDFSLLSLQNVSLLNKRTNLASKSTTRRTFIIWRWFTFNLALTRWSLSDMVFSSTS